MKISFTQHENVWQLKGARHGGNEVLICVFTCTRKDDEEQMRHLIESITYIGSDTKSKK